MIRKRTASEMNNIYNEHENIFEEMYEKHKDWQKQIAEKAHVAEDHGQEVYFRRRKGSTCSPLIQVSHEKDILCHSYFWI